jgi:hypothetical protein
MVSRDSVDGIATSYRLEDRGVGVRAPVGSRIFSSPNRPIGTGGSFLGGKAAGAWSWPLTFQVLHFATSIKPALTICNVSILHLNKYGCFTCKYFRAPPFSYTFSFAILKYTEIWGKLTKLIAYNKKCRDRLSQNCGGSYMNKQNMARIL